MPDVSDERLPKEPLRGAKAVRARDEAAQMQEMMRLPAWGIVTAGWAKHAKAQRAALDKAKTAEGVRAAQSRLTGGRMPLALVEELLRVGAEADDELGNPTPEKPPVPVGSSVAQALLVRQRAQAVEALVAHPGWKVLVRHMVAMAHAASRLKEVCPPEIAPVLDGLRDALTEPIRQLQTEIRHGACAGAWLASHQAEAEQ